MIAYSLADRRIQQDGMERTQRRISMVDFTQLRKKLKADDRELEN